jgi:hypothetical protein
MANAAGCVWTHLHTLIWLGEKEYCSCQDESGDDQEYFVHLNNIYRIY